MRNKFRAAALSALVLSTAGHAQEMKGDVAWDILAGLTTEVGPRMAGSEAEARARAWAQARLTALGFTGVASEPFVIRGYVRGRDEASLIAPMPFKLAVTALGYSGTTPEKGIEGEVEYFASLDALKAAPAGSLTGKIAFIDHAMKRSQDGSGYGPYGQVRRVGPSIASTKGAAGVVIRSIGTDSHRNPHTGGTNFAEGVKPIPAGAVSNPDADLIARIAGSGKPMRIALTLTGRTTPNMTSGNVIGDLAGSNPALPPILVGCHLTAGILARARSTTRRGARSSRRRR